jgi:hypothetical protein
MNLIKSYSEFSKKVIKFPIEFYSSNKYKTSTKIIISCLFVALIVIFGKKTTVNKNSGDENNSSISTHSCRHCGKSFQGKGYMYAFNTYIQVKDGQGYYCSGYCASEHNKHR